MATGKEKIPGCGRHKAAREDIQSESAFDDFFHFDCLHCPKVVSPNPRLCEYCQTWNLADSVFKRYFNDDVPDDPRTVAEYGRESTCILCQALYEAVLEKLKATHETTPHDQLTIVNCGPYHFEGTVRDQRDHIVNLRARGGVGRCVFLLLVSPDGGAFYVNRMSWDKAREGLGDDVVNGVWKDEFLPVQVELKYEMSGCGLLEATRWEKVNMDVGELRQLVAEHEMPQSDAVQGELPVGFRLIDTFEKCIVEPQTRSDLRFATLSYTWGSSLGQPCEDLTTDRLDTMTEPGALKEKNYPYIIWDAIKLCQDLGERFLWTDRLCILQDDPNDLGGQVGQMDRIYGQAALCIASVVDHKLDSGLPGVRGRPRRSFLENATRRFENGFPTIEDDLEAMLDRSDWNTRGWTFQERILSRSCIFISNFNWCFVSGSIVHHEDLGELDMYLLRANTAGRRTISDPWGIAINAHDYLDLVTHYTGRRLTYKTDILNAFAGIANVVSKQSQTQYMFGLFEKFFLAGLLFGHSSEVQRLQNGIPSWSWAAWDGPADYQSVYRDSPIPDAAHLGPLIKFHYSNPTDGIVVIKQEKHWFNVKYEGDVPDLSKKPSSNANRVPKEDPAITTERWKACPHNPWTAVEHQALAAEQMELARRHPGALVFNTTMATLRIEHDTDPNVIFILNPARQRIGHLMRDYVNPSLRPWQKYDFIVLSAGRPSSDVAAKKKRGVEDPIGMLQGYEEYGEEEGLWTLNLMVVERAGEVGLWRRVAIGFVLMRHWAGCEVRCETIVLV